MTVRFRIYRKKVSASDALALYSNVYVRLRDGRAVDQTVRTEILVRGGCWDSRHECIKSKSAYPLEERASVDASISSLRAFIATEYVSAKIDGAIVDGWLKGCVDRFHKKSYGTSFKELFSLFLGSRELSEQREKQYLSLQNIIGRYEVFMSESNGRRYRFDIEKLEPRDLNQIWHFLANEHDLCRDYPALMECYKGSKAPRARGKNTIIDLFKKMRAFFNWCKKEGLVKSSPFDSYHLAQELYGTPVCLAMEEVRKIAGWDFRKNKGLARQRDIFVFQCNVGFRVSDLIRMRKCDIVDGCISFIPSKTISENPRTVVVPLNKTAMRIVERYSKDESEKLLPFISVQKYNDSIKRVLRECGITRMVTVLDPLTRRERRIPICEVASSHMARRTFVNNIYRKVKDPALVSALTGHVEGSRAFSRYREIDDEVKKELVRMLE